MLLSAHVERVSVSHVRYFLVKGVFQGIFKFLNKPQISPNINPYIWPTTVTEVHNKQEIS